MGRGNARLLPNFLEGNKDALMGLIHAEASITRMRAKYHPYIYLRKLASSCNSITVLKSRTPEVFANDFLPFSGVAACLAPDWVVVARARLLGVFRVHPPCRSKFSWPDVVISVRNSANLKFPPV